MSDAEFFFDPVCPWSWLTSQWIREVQLRRDLDIEWRFLSLRLLNDGRIDYAADPARHETHQLGLRLLRVAHAARESGYGRQVAELYRLLGTRIHLESEPEPLADEQVLRKVLVAANIDPDLAAAAGDQSRDHGLRAEKDEALARTGGDVGTPIITFRPPDGPAFFGPIITKVPRGLEARRLWDLVTELAAWPGFAELKRSARGEREVA